ncbi:TetR/AcrR family transcriptional regulator [Cohnella abietis]|uniref:TetR family transcriptional regulator n=1 Tax=Cohnella abietis TaxID=2507935 RepID=A0A3T1D736_9BACL|nr:TetR/AcrR family transcriptional regulator [Cohnella abietis]BBI33892.1 TetR family transcriptional regulator [Cohnella abietis]
MAKVDRRIPKTKDAIHKALVELMTEKDFDNITINDISERANINRGTLYLHYSDKYDLLNKTIEYHLGNMLHLCVVANPENEGLDVLQSLLPVFQYFDENFLFYSSMLTNKGVTCFHDQLMQVIINKLYERMEKGVMNQEFDREVLVQFMASAYVGAVEWWIKNNRPNPPEFMAQQVKNIFESSHLFSHN